MPIILIPQNIDKGSNNYVESPHILDISRVDPQVHTLLSTSTRAARDTNESFLSLRRLILTLYHTAPSILLKNPSDTNPTDTYHDHLPLSDLLVATLDDALQNAHNAHRHQIDIDDLTAAIKANLPERQTTPIIVYIGFTALSAISVALHLITHAPLQFWEPATPILLVLLNTYDLRTRRLQRRDNAELPDALKSHTT